MKQNRISGEQFLNNLFFIFLKFFNKISRESEIKIDLGNIHKWRRS